MLCSVLSYGLLQLGVGLRQYLISGQLPAALTCRVQDSISALCLALAMMHMQHRDIPPAQQEHVRRAMASSARSSGECSCCSKTKPCRSMPLLMMVLTATTHQVILLTCTWQCLRQYSIALPGCWQFSSTILSCSALLQSNDQCWHSFCLPHCDAQLVLYYCTVLYGNVLSCKQPAIFAPSQ